MRGCVNMFKGCLGQGRTRVNNQNGIKNKQNLFQIKMAVFKVVLSLPLLMLIVYIEPTHPNSGNEAFI